MLHTESVFVRVYERITKRAGCRKYRGGGGEEDGVDNVGRREEQTCRGYVDPLFLLS